MLSPDYLLRVSEGGEAIAETLHNEIIKQIVERIAIRLDRGDNYILTARDKWQIKVLTDAGFLREDIEKTIAKHTGLMQKEIAEAMEEAGIKSMEYDDKIYRAAGLSTEPLTKSPHLIRMLQRGYEATVGEWVNFTRTTADAAQESFIQSCDKAYNMVYSGASGYSQAFVDAINEIIDKGVYVTYPSGHKDTIETATLRCIRTGVSQATAEITDARMEEMEWDTILVSSHLGARVTDKEDFTNHYWWQGKFYSKSGNDKRFPPYSVCNQGHVQGIHGANCRHQHGPGDGEFNPYKEYDSEENKKIYDLQQKQRAMERRIRDSKRKVIGLKQSIDSAGTEESKAKLQEEYEKEAALLQKRNQAYNEFCEKTGLKKQNERITIAQWDRSQAAKARAAAKKYAVDHPNAVVPNAVKKSNKAKILDPFSLEERKNKLSVVQASSISEAIEKANQKGIRYPRFEKMDLAQVNNMLNAVDTLPDDCKPAMIANGKDISLATQRPLGRKADQWWGVTYDYRPYSLATMYLGYEKTDYSGGLLVGFNTTKYKTLEALTNAKVSNNAKYYAKTGRNWSFNTDGRATAYHEFGHCFVDVRGLPKNWEILSAKWAEESKCDILKKPDEAFAEAWAAFHMADERLPGYIADAIMEAIGGIE